MKHLRNKQWQRRLLLSLVFCMCTILLTGAQEISRELLQRPAQLDQVQKEIGVWTNQLFDDGAAPIIVPDDSSLQISCFLLKTCSYPTP